MDATSFCRFSCEQRAAENSRFFSSIRFFPALPPADGGQGEQPA